MADLIGREALLKGTCNSCDGWCDVVDCDCLNCESDHRCDIVNDIIYAPTVDAVEVVRCKDCKKNPNFAKTSGKRMVWCRKWRCEVKESGFCSYGERREENAAD